MALIYPSPTVNVNAKGLDARDENVNTKIKFAAVDQVRQIHVPGKMGLVIPGRMGSIGAIRMRGFNLCAISSSLWALGISWAELIKKIPCPWLLPEVTYKFAKYN